MYSPIFMCSTGTDLEKPLVCLSVLANDNSDLGIFWKKGGFLTEDLQRQEVWNILGNGFLGFSTPRLEFIFSLELISAFLPEI